MSDSAAFLAQLTNLLAAPSTDGAEGTTATGEHSDEGSETTQSADAGTLAQAWTIEGMGEALRPQPPLEYVVEGLVTAPSLSILYGGPGSLKSMLLADMAISVATGSQFLPPLPGKNYEKIPTFKTAPAPVLWVDFDNGARRTRERLGALGRTRGATPETPLHYVSMPLPWLDASDRSMIEELSKLLCNRRYKLLAIDNLGLVSGAVEENSSEMTLVMGHFRWLCETAGCAIVVVHHQRKGSTAGAATGGARKGDALRGHSSIEAAIDLALVVERAAGSDAVQITATKVRDYIPVEGFGALWTYEHVLESSQLATGRFFGQAAETGEEAKRTEIKAIITDFLRSGVKPQKEIVDNVRDEMAAAGGSAPGINRVRGLLAQMVKDGQLLISTFGTTKEYRLI